MVNNPRYQKIYLFLLFLLSYVFPPVIVLVVVGEDGPGKGVGIAGQGTFVSIAAPGAVVSITDPGTVVSIADLGTVVSIAGPSTGVCIGMAVGMTDP